MMRSLAYNRFGVLMGTSSRASGPRWLSLRGDSLPMRTLIASQGDFCATAVDALLEIGDADHDVVNTRQHSDSSRARDYRMRAGLSPSRYCTGGVPAVRSLR